MRNVKEEFTIPTKIEKLISQGHLLSSEILEKEPPFDCKTFDIDTNIKNFSKEDFVSNTWDNICKDNGVYGFFKINNEALVLFLENSNISIDGGSYDEICKVVTPFLTHNGFDYFISFIQEIWEDSIIDSVINEFSPKIISVSNDLQKLKISDNVSSSYAIGTNLLDFLLKDLMSKGIDAKRIEGEEFKDKVSEKLEETLQKEVVFQKLRKIIDQLNTFKDTVLYTIENEELSIDEFVKKFHLFVEKNIPSLEEKDTQHNLNKTSVENIVLKAIQIIPEGRQAELVTLITEFAENTKHQPEVPFPTNTQEMKALGIKTYLEFQEQTKKESEGGKPSRDGRECLKQNWGQFLKVFNPKLDRDYMSRADLISKTGANFDEQLIGRLKKQYTAEEMNAFLPSLPMLNDQIVEKLTEDEKREISRKNNMIYKNR